MDNPQVEFVIARYHEDLSWLRDVPENVAITIYDKGPTIDFPIEVDNERVRHTSLPNEGREAGTYLHHIVFNYNDLAPVTVFLQGTPHDHADRIPTSLEDMEGNDFLDLARHVTTDNEFGLPNHGGLPGAGSLPIKAIYERMFQRPAPRLYVFGAGAQFAVTRELIHSKPMSWWALLFSTTRHEYPDTGAWAMERLWPSIFKENL